MMRESKAKQVPSTSSIAMTDAGIQFKRAFYIKLGTGGKWAEDSLQNGLLRIGWPRVPLSAIEVGDWESVRRYVAEEHRHKGTVTTDTARLKDVAESDPDDVWITFHASHLWWCQLAPGRIEEDQISKFRRVKGTWRQHDTRGRPLHANAIPGQIAQLQGFRGTICSVREHEALHRLLNGISSPAFQRVDAARHALATEVQEAVRSLHWKDFETLVDLVFRGAGWRRRSMLGETMKYADLELEEPITGDLYQVQIKSKAEVADFERYAAQFGGGEFRRLFFVVHSPSPKLEALTNDRSDIEIVLPSRLGEMIVDGGLVGWVMNKVR
jgi:hypothetical protein